MQSMSVFLDTAKFPGFLGKNDDVSKIQWMCHVIRIFFGPFLGRV